MTATGSVTVGGPSDDELAQVEVQVREALRGGDESSLRMLAWGEIGPVLGWPAAGPAYALKRLPPFAGEAALTAFATTLLDYLAALDGRGLATVATELRALPGGAERVAYVVQPLLPPASLGPAVLAAADPALGHPMVAAIVDANLAVPGPGLALDGQTSNFAWVDGRLLYLDVTTPLIFDQAGQPRMDVDLLLRALPAALRPGVRRWVVPDLLDRWRDPRTVMLDMLGNLLKERLDAWVPVALELTGGRVSPPLTEAEIRQFYRSDARLWELLLRLRRLDRAWQRRVRRREYAFLLPGRIER